MPRKPTDDDRHDPKEVDDSMARTGPDDEPDADELYGEPDVRNDEVTD